MAARSGLRLLKARLEIYYYDPARHLPFDHLNPPLSPKFSLSQLDSQIKDFVGNFLPPNCITFPNVATEQAMADYTSLKVPDLKKLLSERKLSLTGNKPELIKRLQDADAAIPDNAAPDADAGKLY
jgi:SAP domain-containing ribonucleoprotein